MKISSLWLSLAGLVLCAPVLVRCGPVLAQSDSGDDINIQDSARQTASCGGLVANRKEISDMTNTEWNNYVRALNGVRTNGVYANYVQIHDDNAVLAHGGCYFLPWHRQYLYRFERELNRIVPGVTIPYWDWTKIVSGQRINTAFANDPVWNSRMGGANGNGPIPRSPFQGWSVGGATVTRDFVTGNGNVGGGGSTFDFLSSEQVSAVARGSDSYADFLTFLEGGHNTVHVAIGGTMSGVPTSPRDPMFWSHHAYVDKIWRDWQAAGSGNEFGGSWSGGSCSVSTTMTPFSVSVSQIFSGTSQCTTYQGSSAAGPTSRFNLMDISVRQGSSPALSVSSDAERRRYLSSIAQKKQSEPDVYKADVSLGLSQVDSMQRASRAFGMAQDRIDRTTTLYRNLLLKQGVDVVNDASVVSLSAAAIVANGQAQAASVASASASGDGSGSSSASASRGSAGNETAGASASS